MLCVNKFVTIILRLLKFLISKQENRDGYIGGGGQGWRRGTNSRDLNFFEDIPKCGWRSLIDITAEMSLKIATLPLPLQLSLVIIMD